MAEKQYTREPPQKNQIGVAYHCCAILIWGLALQGSPEVCSLVCLCFRFGLCFYFCFCSWPWTLPICLYLVVSLRHADSPMLAATIELHLSINTFVGCGMH